MIKQIYQNLLHLPQQIIHTIKHTNIAQLAASLTYISLLSMVPLGAVCFYLFSKLPFITNFNRIIQNFIFDHLVTESANNLSQYFGHFIDQANQLPWFSICFLLLTGYFLFSSIETALNQIWAVSKRRFSPIAIPLYCITPILMVSCIGMATLISTFALQILSTYTNPLFQPILSALIFLGPYVLGLIILTALYQLLPNVHVPTFCAVYGALVAVLLFTISKYVVSLYFTHVTSYHIIYGTLVSIPIFLTWIYVLWMVILSGAVVSHSLYATYDTPHKKS